MIIKHRKQKSICSSRPKISKGLPCRTGCFIQNAIYIPCHTYPLTLISLHVFYPYPVIITEGEIVSETIGQIISRGATITQQYVFLSLPPASTHSPKYSNRGTDLHILPNEVDGGGGASSDTADSLPLNIIFPTYHLHARAADALSCGRFGQNDNKVFH